jgi:hypothetical protein
MICPLGCPSVADVLARRTRRRLRSVASSSYFRTPRA